MFCNDDIKEINGVSFSSREIEVISCISNGLSVKDIGLFINISPHTVSSHIRNIMNKLDCCSSQRQILKFLEASNEHLIVHNKYIDMILFAAFEKLLQQISELKSTDKRKCVIHAADSNSNIGNNLSKYLKLSGIDVDIVCENNSDVHNYKKEFHILFAQSSDIKDNAIYCATSEKTMISNEHIFVEGDYYEVILNCINKIYNSNQIEMLINVYREYCNRKKPEIVAKNQGQLLQQVAKKKFKPYVLIFISLMTILYFSVFEQKSIAFNVPIINKSKILLRRNIIKSINQSFDKQSGIKYVILAGEGGIGKTTIARYYLHLNNFKLKWEIDAETEYKLIESYSNLAFALANTKKLQEQLSIIQAMTDKNTKTKRLIMFVFAQLKNMKSWCLLFDNVDDFKNIEIFLPLEQDLSGEGNILITTRNENLNNVSYFHIDSMIKVSYLAPDEQLKLFCNILHGNDSSSLSEGQNTTTLAFLQDISAAPLDTSIVAHYIKVNNTSFGDYKKQVSNTDFEDKHNNFNNFSYPHTRASIVATSFEKIISENPEHKRQLLLLCLLDSLNISIEYFKKFNNIDVVNDFIYALRKYSIIETKDSVLAIHRSTQRLGLKFLMQKLSVQEKEKYIEEIVSMMSQYKYMIPNWYKDIKSNMTLKDKIAIIPHLQSLLSKIEGVGLNSDNFNALKIKTLLTILYAGDAMLPYYEMQKLADSILDLNFKNDVLGDYDLALLYIYNAKICSYCGEKDKCIKYAQKCIDISKKINAQELLALGLVYFSSFMEQNMQSLQMLEDSRAIIEKCDKNKSNGIAIEIANRYCNCFGHTYINKQEAYKAINFLIQILKTNEISEELKNKSATNVNKIIGILEIRLNLIRAYEKIADHKNALKQAIKLQSIYSKLNADGVSFNIRIARLNIELGLVSLRLGDVKKANDILSEVLKSNILFESKSPGLFYAFAYRSEVLIRLGKFNQAYADCTEAFAGKKSTSGSNYANLITCTCYYNMAIAKYKMKEKDEALKQFEIFFDKAKAFCKVFLDDDKFVALEKANVFATDKDLRQCLLNSAAIFISVYGAAHPFVKDYVQKIDTF